LVKESVDGLRDRVAAVRAFNRFYTGVIGVLRDGLLRSPYSLTEARVIFELGQRQATEVADLRRALGVDAGYLSRLIARFDANGLTTRERSRSDGRRQVLRLTERGRAAYEMLDGRATAEVRGLLSGLTDEDQRRLIGAMGAIRRVLQDAPERQPYLLREPAPGDLGWVVHRHGVLYAEEYGWDEAFEVLVARVVADYAEHRDPKRERAWIAELDGEPVGCVFCMRADERTAQLRLLLVEPHARGMGIGQRLVDECLRFARRTGYQRIMLWTNDVLVQARRIYERAGFELVDEETHHRFGTPAVGQHWARPLS
jgi:DNA-binding MarR family transcriptional regulator/GNAT superfamily N-acetyltransferase